MKDSRLSQVQPVLQQLLDYWKARSKSYGKVRYGCAIAKEKDQWVQLMTYFIPLHKADADIATVHADYGRLQIVAGTFSIAGAKSVLQALVKETKYELPHLPKFQCTVTGHIENVRFCDSSDPRLPLDYSFHEFRFHAAESLSREDRRIVYTRDLPFYPTIDAAVNSYFRTSGAYPGYHGEVVCVAPDYRGRISNIRLSAAGVEVEIQCPRGSDTSDLLVKVHYELEDGTFKTGDSDINNGIARFHSEAFPTKASVILISQSTDALVDEKYYRGVYAYRDPKITIDSTAQDIDNLRLSGESLTLEFKEKFTSGEDIAKAAVSFANTRGGQILIGIADDGRVIGISGDKFHDRVESMLRSHCEPSLNVKVEVLQLDHKTIATITVPQGTDKPYNVHDHGIYIRSGATSRVATRYEVEQMMKAKTALSFPGRPGMY